MKTSYQFLINVGVTLAAANALAEGPAICRPKVTCATIVEVYQDGRNKYHCVSTDGFEFSCEQLVAQIGTDIIGLEAQVISRTVDVCHVPGECGFGGACRPLYGVASLGSCMPSRHN